MTTDKTPATLATVKHGGRVQLGDWLPPLPASSAYDPTTGEPLFSVSKIKLYAHAAVQAALSAQPSPFETLPPEMRSSSPDYLDYLDTQPSPGGQGDACIERAAKALHAHGADNLCNDVLWDDLHQPEADQFRSWARAALVAARQPVGENPAWRDELVREAYNRGLADGLNADRQPVGEPVTVPGAPTSCRHCDSTDLKWFAHVRTLNDVQQGRLNTHDVGCVFVLGCEECSETLRVVKADDIAALLDAAPPVHAQDLGQIWQQAFYDTAHSYRRNKSRMWVLQMMKERVQALLDSQAVGK